MKITQKLCEEKRYLFSERAHCLASFDNLADALALFTHRLMRGSITKQFTLCKSFHSLRYLLSLTRVGIFQFLDPSNLAQIACSLWYHYARVLQ